jgi:hypothetical protein
MGTSGWLFLNKVWGPVGDPYEYDVGPVDRSYEHGIGTSGRLL